MKKDFKKTVVRINKNTKYDYFLFQKLKNDFKNPKTKH
jgi:hypothetical protein